MDETRCYTEYRKFSNSTVAIVSGQFRRLAVIASVFTALISLPAQADQWSLLVNGKAIHLENPPGTRYNESNWGAGAQYDFKMTESKWIPFISVSGFNDSNKNPSYYAGGGTMRRFAYGDTKNSLHLDAGVVAFLMVRRGYLDGKPFPGVLPVVSLGTDRIALNITYIPKVEPKMVPIIFFQLKVGLF